MSPQPASAPGARDGAPGVTPSDVHLTLSPSEAEALLALAVKGRVFLDVDPAFLAAHSRRLAARRAVARLRDQIRTGAPA